MNMLPWISLGVTAYILWSGAKRHREAMAHIAALEAQVARTNERLGG